MGSIQLKDVRKAFGAVNVINGVSLDISEGEFAVFVGPSGCGKSTLLRLIAGLEDVTSGQVLIDAKDMTNVTAAPLTNMIASFSAPEGDFWALLSAASVLAIAPILILGWFSQKQLVRGLTFGAVK